MKKLALVKYLKGDDKDKTTILLSSWAKDELEPKKNGIVLWKVGEEPYEEYEVYCIQVSDSKKELEEVELNHHLNISDNGSDTEVFHSENEKTTKVGRPIVQPKKYKETNKDSGTAAEKRIKDGVKVKKESEKVMQANRDMELLKKIKKEKTTTAPECTQCHCKELSNLVKKVPVYLNQFEKLLDEHRTLLNKHTKVKEFKNPVTAVTNVNSPIDSVTNTTPLTVASASTPPIAAVVESTLNDITPPIDNVAESTLANTAPPIATVDDNSFTDTTPPTVVSDSTPPIATVSDNTATDTTPKAMGATPSISAAAGKQKARMPCQFKHQNLQVNDDIVMQCAVETDPQKFTNLIMKKLYGTTYGIELGEVFMSQHTLTGIGSTKCILPSTDGMIILGVLHKKFPKNTNDDAKKDVRQKKHYISQRLSLATKFVQKVKK